MGSKGSYLSFAVFLAERKITDENRRQDAHDRSSVEKLWIVEDKGNVVADERP